VRTLVFILLGLLGGLAVAQENVVQIYGSPGPMTTAAFTVKDKWEVRWDCPDAIAVTVLAADGSVVAGGSGAMKGSLYQPKGGTFTLQIARAGTAGSSPWHAVVVELGATSTDTGAVTYYIPPLTASSAPSTNVAENPAAPVATAISPLPPTNAPPAAPASPDLTQDEANAVVVVKGDVGEGTGFLVHTADGPAVVTNQHVIFANPNVKILTTMGKEIKTLSLKGASDRDLAMFMIQDDHYTYFDLATNIDAMVQTGDEVITPGNSEGGEVLLNTKGTVMGLGPERIEFSNPIYHGNSGGPVFHPKTGKVLAVVTMGQKVKPTDDLDKASFANANSAITATMRYFGLRLYTVPKWEVFDWNRFLTETTFLKQFHDHSRELDSFINGATYERAKLASADENGPPDSRFWLRNPKIQTIQDNYHRLATDSDQSQRLDAIREEVMDLESVADADMAAIQNPANFYGFDQKRAAQEVEYRKALRTEVEKYGNKISDMGH
jgi:hypothetical protein